MKLRFGAASILILLSATTTLARERLLMDANWRFTLNDPPDAGNQFDYPEIADLAKAHPTDAAAIRALDAKRKDPVQTHLGESVSFVQPGFDDSGWRKLDLPHDWAVELPFDEHALMNHGYKDIGPKLGNTIGWYRRQFSLPAADRGKTIWIDFDGVFRNSVVWINGHCLGRNVSGYTGFWYDISHWANYGGNNELVVRVDATRVEGWFYEGTGIYRHVWMTKLDPLHVAHWGTFVHSAVDGTNATVSIQTTLESNDARPIVHDVELDSAIVDASGKTIAQLNQAGLELDDTTKDINSTIKFPGVHLWDLDDPYLYTLVTTVKQAGVALDEYRTPFGIRTLEFNKNGFFLNGKHVWVQGTCNHQDFAGVGAAMPDALQYFRVRKLKEMGSNAYRTSHNDPTPELLDACDKLGMLVLDEHRQMGDDAEHLGQLTRLIMRDRNHPSVFMWSLGNEEGKIDGIDYGANVARKMQDLAHKLDPTRLCTIAQASHWGKGISGVLDVQGFNYHLPGIDAYHRVYPDRLTIGTETSSAVATRGCTIDDAADDHLADFDTDKVKWGATAEEWWSFYHARPWLTGGFAWTGFDYRGEPTPYKWPEISSQFGILDMCGFPKASFYYYQAWWGTKPMVKLLPHWNWAGQEGKPITVKCYSNLARVELFLNGKSLGSKPMPPFSHLEWKVPYEPGTLEAKAERDNQTAESRLETTGAPAEVVLSPDRATIDADGRDVSVVAVAIADDQGRTVPTADNLVQFHIDGDAKIIGVGNGQPNSLEPDKAEKRSAFNGLCMVLVQAGRNPGGIHLTASSGGLRAGDTTIITRKSDPIPELQ